MADVLPFPDRRAIPRRPSGDLPPDAGAREAALDIRQSAIVEAPAGSGKTGLLIQRFLKLLADPAVTEPEQVLAITFTVKATGELRDRVLAQLHAAASGAPIASAFDRHTRTLAGAVLVRDAAQAWGLLTRPERLRIRTIDSVCAEIARSLPVLSGSGGEPTPLLDAAPLHREAARRTLMQLGGLDPVLNDALRTLLLHRDGNLSECERLIAEMLAGRDAWGSLIPLAGDDLTDAALDRGVLPRLEAALDSAICASLQQLARSIPATVLQSLTFLAAEMGHAEGYKGKASPIALCANLRSAPRETADHLSHWRALIHLLATGEGTWRASMARNHLHFDVAKAHSTRLKEIIQQLAHRDDLLAAFREVRCLPPARYPDEQWLVTKALFRILRTALIELQLVFATQNACDFTELGLLARTALRRDAHGNELAAALGMRLQHLLVDEMQDTSTSQYELIERLTEGWDGRSQTVFLVGDPKQSIYGFRQARVERFLHTMRHGRLGDLPLQTLRLTANFRTQRNLVAAFNHDFHLVFPSESTATHPEDVAFVAAEPTRDAAETAGRVWHTAVISKASIPALGSRARVQQRTRDAAAIRRVVEHWCARPPCRDLRTGETRPWTIGILVRTRTHVAEIVAAFKQHPAIPFRAVDIDSLAERPEVLDLLALTRALLHPADRVAWLAILRAPWCGLTLVDLHLLAGADDRSHAETTTHQLIASRGDLLSPDGCHRLERLWTVMQAASAHRARLPVALWVERTWRSLGGDTWLDPEPLANIHRFFQLLDDLERETATIDPALLENRLKRLFAEASHHPSAVDITTIHKAKGLEWDIVIVPGMERGTRKDTAPLLAFAEINSSDNFDDPAAPSHIVLAPIAGRGEDSQELNEWIRSIHTVRNAAERKRLLYVASTRAREELHLFASPEFNKNGDVCLAFDSLLKTAWPAIENLFVTTPKPAKPSAFPGPVLLQPEEDAALLSLAAGADTDTKPHEKAPERSSLPLHRLPSTFSVPAHFASYTPLRRPTQQDEGTSTPSFTRPEGSFAARALGNTIHAFLDLIASRIAAGEHPAVLQAALPTWTPRIAALLRGNGLPPAIVERLTGIVQRALSNTLADPVGQWLLAPHPGAASEHALTAPGSGTASTIRLDRIFRAGPDPLAPGTTHLWIVDYKTTTHGPGHLDAFLRAEREKYTPQMLAYASLFAPTEPHLRTLLFYPLLPAHTWWTPEPITPLPT